MAVGLVELVVLLAVLGLLGYGGWLVWTTVRAPSPGPPGAGRLPPRDRAWLAQAIARARWAPAHDEVDGATRVLVRRACTGLDGRPQVLEERVVAAFPADDPAWEARFTEAMAQARFRCEYLNTEERQG